MKVEDIDRYCQLLPAYARRFDYDLDAGGTDSTNHQRLNRKLHARSNPRFAWDFVKTLVECQCNPPLGVKDPWILRAYVYEKGVNHDPTMEKIVMMSSRNCLFQYAVQAYLIHPEYTFEQIAGVLGVSVRVIEGYESLFFNVRDRMSDLEYMQTIVWPVGRYVEREAGYHQVAGFGRRLLQSSIEHGPEKALAAAGFNRGWRALTNGSSALQETLTLMTGSANLALWGTTGGHSNAAPLKSVMNIVIAQAQSGAPQDSVSEMSGINSLGDMMLGTLRELTNAGKNQPVIDVQVVTTPVPEESNKS